ncbi:NAD(P)-binding protein [Paraphaeosphaeria sporulosa]|uniref:NAD(P)-binding protein n=1 Tax=Paraphaeosphaeria sporulosa TaxID=1460663 RepID=A0A177CKK6_9PLEO|nr:NAD(P)-binding protein [Paraphaeosphaeria sporulosa]OAG08055.1 NAD(P)-binding protein [Paraphaeosphaeria sporulosa]
MTKIFITGATGYIGGDTLYELYNKYPDYEYTALVRTEEKGKQVTSKFPKVRIVQGDNDSTDLLKEESAKANIVIHTADASDNVNAANAIAAGLTSGHSSSNPGYWLHTGGTGILTYFDSRDGKLGENSDKVFNDLEGVDELISLPSEAFHRNIDEIVINCGRNEGDKVKTAVVCPPTIYGEGRGPSLTRGRQVYELAKLTLQRGKGPTIGHGKARWNNVHVHDLARAFVLLVDAAVAGRTDDGLWGEQGYYFTENGEHYWAELSARIAESAKKQGFIQSAETEALDEETAKKVAGFESISWGLNSRGEARRLKKLLGWKPVERSIEDEVDTIVQNEHDRLQKE